MIGLHFFSWKDTAPSHGVALESTEAGRVAVVKQSADCKNGGSWSSRRSVGLELAYCESVSEQFVDQVFNIATSLNRVKVAFLIDRKECRDAVDTP